MMSATYFGEITELGSRAIWYSDEEDDDEDENEDEKPATALAHKSSPCIQPMTHADLRASQSNLHYESHHPAKLPKFSSIVISLALGWRLNSPRLENCDSLSLLGTFGANIGKAFAYRPTTASEPLATPQNQSLWLVFNSHCPQVQSDTVGYFVEHLRELLYTEFQVDPSLQMIILSSQYSDSEHLEYLSNLGSNQSALNQQQQQAASGLPFTGRPLQPPALIRNQFESALFEQSTLSLQPALVVCLPDPRNFWFDHAKHWPAIAKEIVEQKLNDDNLEKTLIFT